MTALVTDHLMLSLTLAFIGALGGLALTVFEQARAGGQPDLPNPLGLLVTSLVSWVAFGLAWLLAFLTGNLAFAVLSALLAFAITRTKGGGISLARYAPLRTPLAFAALIFTLILWLGTFALME